MKRACFGLCRIFLLFWFLILPACKPDSIPPAALSQSHSWQVPPVLAMMFTSAVLTPENYAWSVVPSFLLHADGRVIVTEEHYQAFRIISETRLDLDEVCSLLYQIASDGFLTLKQSDYVRPQMTDQSTTEITVNAWQPNTISAYGLGFAGQLPPALKATAERLSNYLPANAQPYQPDRLAVRLYPVNSRIAAPLWPLSQPTSAQLMTQVTGISDVVLVEGQTAQAVYHEFAGSVSKIYSENGNTYNITIRPVFPCQKWSPDQHDWSPPSAFATEPRTTLTCAPDMIKSGTTQPTTATPTK